MIPPYIFAYLSLPKTHYHIPYRYKPKPKQYTIVDQKNIPPQAKSLQKNLEISRSHQKQSYCSSNGINLQVEILELCIEQQQALFLHM